VNPGLDEDKPELGIPVLAVALQMLPDGHGLLDQMVDVLRQVGGGALGLEDAQDLVSGHEPDLCHTVGITKDDSDLGRGQTLLGQLEDLVLDVIRRELEPGRHRATVRQSRLGNSLSGGVHATHDEGLKGTAPNAVEL